MQSIKLSGVVIAEGGETVLFGKAIKCCLPVSCEVAWCAVMVEKTMKADGAGGEPNKENVEELRMEPCKIDDEDFAAKIDRETWEVEWF